MKSRFPFNYKSIIPAAVIILTFLVLFAARSLPVTRIWKGYQVLYVQNTVKESDVLEVLAQNGCRDVVSLSLQKIPVFSKLSPVQPQPENSYLSRRDGYFHDETRQYLVFYIPDTFEKQTSRALTQLIKDRNVKAGVDGKSTFPWLVPLVSLLFFMILLLASDHKTVFFCSGIFIVLLSFVKPYYAVAAVVCVVLLSFFLAQKYWSRKGAWIVVWSNAGIDLLLASAVVFSFVFSWKCGLLLILTLLAAMSSLMLAGQWESSRAQPSGFSYELILPAKFLNIYRGNAGQYMLVSIGSIAVILVLFLFSARFVPQTSVSELSLPSPYSINDKKSQTEQTPVLPSVQDFYSWCWYTITFPYRNMNSSDNRMIVAPARGDRITQTRYRSTAKGIETYEDTVFEFDTSFFDQMDHQVEGLSYPAVEKLLKKQGRNTGVRYSQKSSGETGRDLRSLIVLILCLVIPLIVYLYYNISGKLKISGSKKHENGK